MDIRFSPLADDFRDTGSSVLSGYSSSRASGDLRSGLSDPRDPESDCLQAEACAIAAANISGCLGGLTDAHYDVIVCRYWHNLTFGEIGAIFEINEAAAKKLHDRAIERLRDSFALIGYTQSDVAA